MRRRTVASVARSVTERPPLPDQLAAYHQVLGDELTVRLVLVMGGVPLSLSPRPRAACQLVQCVGYDKAVALHDAVGKRVRIPLPKRWLAKSLAFQEVGVHEIARLMRISDVTVRAYLRDEYASSRQLDLFGE